jgi:hypothetical protein
MSEHTPGPWEARGKAIVVRGSPRWNNAYNGRICNVQGAGEGDNKINKAAKANARLIAAAPQMLDALEAVALFLHWLDQEQGIHLAGDMLHGNILEAIKAAKGG